MTHTYGRDLVLGVVHDRVRPNLHVLVRPVLREGGEREEEGYGGMGERAREGQKGREGERIARVRNLRVRTPVCRRWRL